MKQTLHPCALLLLFLILILSYESIGLLSTNQGKDVKVGEIKSASLGADRMEDDNSINQLMGFEMESCVDGDEECLKRRLVAEAHLDYIYTQQNKH